MAKVIIDLLEQAKSLLEDIKENTTPSAGSGLKSISISPAIQTTPALDSLFPIYWDDLTEEEKLNGIQYTLGTSDDIPDSVDITVTPTPDWYAGEEEEIGVPAVYTAEKENGKIVASIDVSNGEIPISPDFAIVRVVLTIQSK